MDPDGLVDEEENPEGEWTDSDVSEHGDEVIVREVLLTESKKRWGPESKHGVSFKRKFIREFVELREERGDGAIRSRTYIWTDWKFAGTLGVHLRQWVPFAGHPGITIPPFDIDPGV